MTTTERNSTYNLGPDEKAAQVMVYTATSFYWGEVVVKNIIRVSTWLRTNTVPNRISLYNAMGLITLPGCKPFSFSEVHIPLGQIQAFHLIPPAQDPPDFDPTEPNRMNHPIGAIINSFIIKGSLRLSASADLKKFLEVTHETFTSIYDAEVSNPAVQSFRGLSVPYLLVRQDAAVFTSRQ